MCIYHTGYLKVLGSMGAGLDPLAITEGSPI